MNYNRLEKSAVLAGRPGFFVKAEKFPISNLVMAPDRYSYEGNWLFCSFDHAELLAARVGFGRGKLDWRDYGLDQVPMNENALFWRLEVITASGILAQLSSAANAGAFLNTASDRLEISFEEHGIPLFSIKGWPDMRWRFRSPDGSLSVDLSAELEGMLLWPDFLLPRNTFGMCLGTSHVQGVIWIDGREFSVKGSGIFDHPRIMLCENSVTPFGWYLYQPIQFEDGSQLACYYSEDGTGQRDSAYSAALVRAPGGRASWLEDCRVANLELDGDGLPVRWETLLRGTGTEVSLNMKIRELPLLRGWGDADPAKLQGKYVAYPLLMEVEGEARIVNDRLRLKHGQGIAEFLVRKGHQPKFP